MGSALVMLSFLGWFLWSQQRGIVRRYQRAGGFEIHSLIQYYSICLYSMIPLGEYAVTFGSKKKAQKSVSSISGRGSRTQKPAMQIEIIVLTGIDH